MRRIFDRKPPKLVNGYRSKFEADVAGDLEARGVDFRYEPFRIKYTKPVKPSTYLPDYVLPNGIFIEAKGYFESADRAKHLIIKEQRPDLDIRFVFQNSNNRLSKTSKTTYGAWAEKNGFKYANKQIPQEWIDEQKVPNPADAEGS